MKLIPITAAAALVLAVTGCAGADTSLPDTPTPVDVTETEGTTTDNGQTNADSGDTTNDESFNANVELDTYQPEKLLAGVEASIELALSNGYAETYQLPGSDFSETILFDPTRPVEESTALDIGDGFSIPAFITTEEEAITGLLELKAEAEAMIAIVESAGNNAAQYVNIITNDGFIFKGTGSGKRIHVVTNTDGNVVSFTETNQEGDRVHSFVYELSSEQEALITEAYNLVIEE